uniref:Ribonuclease H-like domain-containing protein n=1 Tax=Tanacetum cinerariifolium TaxID=118510 RepID=A0A6L2M7D9_TANCI|nr:ribonuclease H-like domain-containing protein [Tanacetum cinerariifolium]
MTDYALWKVIENGATLPKTQIMEGVTTVMPITTIEEKAQRRLELLKAIQKRFGGNAATKKTQRNLLKQQYENLTASSSKKLDQTFDRLEKFVSQLELLDENLLQEDVNQKKLAANGNETIGFDKSNMEFYNYHKRGHFARKCKSPRNQDNKHKESSKRSVPVEITNSISFVSCDGLGGYDWSHQAEEGPNYALMAFLSLSSDSKKGLGYENYNAVPPPYTGIFMPSTPDLSFTNLDEFANKHVAENNKSWEEETKAGNSQMDLQDQGVINSGCSRHMTMNMSCLTDCKEIDGGYVAFGGIPKGGKITGKGTIKTGNLDFENMYFVRVLKFNLFNVSQMCDKKNSVLFNDTKCIVLSSNFKLIDESQVLLRVPRKNNMFSESTPNVISSGPDWLFDINVLARTINYEPIVADDIIFGSTKKELCNEFERLMHEKFQMSSIGELTLFLGLQVKQKKDRIFISQDKHVAEILKKFGFTEVKTASTPIKAQKPLLKDKDDEAVHKELEDSLVRAATTSFSLEVEQDSGNISKTQYKATPNKPSSQRLIQVVVPVNVQDDAKMFDVNDLGDEEVKGIVIQEQEEPGKSTTTTTTISKQQLQDKGKGIMIEGHVKPKKKDQIRLDEEVAKRLQAEFDKEERLARSKQRLIETWDDIQAKIDVDHQLAIRLQA